MGGVLGNMRQCTGEESREEETEGRGFRSRRLLVGRATLSRGGPLFIHTVLTVTHWGIWVISWYRAGFNPISGFFDCLTFHQTVW